MLDFLRKKYPRFVQVVEGFEGLKSQRRPQRDPRQGKRRRKRTTPARAPLSKNGFSTQDSLDFGIPSSTKVFGRTQRQGRMGTLPGQDAPVTSRLPGCHLDFHSGLTIENATSEDVQVRTWCPLPDGERWRGVRLPRDDDSALLGDYTMILAPGGSLTWPDAPADLLLSFHEANGRPASLALAHSDDTWTLFAPESCPVS